VTQVTAFGVLVRKKAPALLVMSGELSRIGSYLLPLLLTVDVTRSRLEPDRAFRAR